MNLYRFGKEFSEIRRSNNISQQRLADTIQCSRKYISLIETGKVAPSTNMIVEMSKILGNDIIDLLKFSDYDDPDFMISTKKKVSLLINSCDYTGLNDQLTIMEHHTDFQTPQNEQYILYLKSICEMEINHDYYKSIDLIKESLFLKKNDDLLLFLHKNKLSSDKIRSYHSLAIIFHFINGYKYSIEILEYLLTHSNISSSLSNLSKVKMYNTLANTYILMDKHTNALNVINKALSIIDCMDLNVLSILHFNKAYILFKCNEIKNSKEYFVMTYYDYKNLNNQKLMKYLIHFAQNNCSIDITPYIL
ncbi:hypothetical protein SH1V18_04970 [Vallitalea longa]|uniref:HTH cro/C1-type domain-containing protein n=1 Tax=Vallitalea longa TaxID=2936439 RepID=A0A9W5Y7M6_9FIRM|nr:helix-turn-helix transcriptional regulator [Vallitalea longa]GKX28017.1 hypothetical protein SH1V18_04970 [Vallitalea longa]